MQIPKGPIMSPKIYPIQSLAPVGNGHMVIKGPIGDWGPDDDAIAVVFTVAVSQVTGTTDDRPNIAMAIGWSGEYTATGDWSATTRPVGAYPLQQGGAIVAAWATIARKDGGYEMYEWTLPVKFV